MAKKVKKAAIVTLRGYYNYGNLLQNYALDRVLRNYIDSVATVDIFPLEYKKERKKIKIKRYFKLVFKPKTFLKILSNRIKKILTSKKRKIYRAKREEIFRDFFEKHLKEIKLTDDVKREYDYFVAGSDQIWGIPDKSHYFLDFCDISKRIVYAASFGASFISDEKKDIYRNNIKDIPHISVRETAGAKIVKELINREVPVLIDPTLMLDKEDWLKISTPSGKKPRDKYMLCYFLGKEAKRLRKECEIFAKNENLKIVDLYNIKIPDYYVNGPAEFIDFIKDAEIIFTNSYHGAIFSIIFEKPFVLAGREGMNSRIDTLTTIFDLKGRLWDNVKEKQNYYSCSYEHVKPILEAERKKAYDYLEKALEINENQ